MNIMETEKETILRGVGKRIQECRLKAKLTQEQVAERTGISQKHLSRIEQGHHDPHFDIVIKLAVALDVSIDAFAEDLACDDSGIFVRTIKSDIDGMSKGQLEMLRDFIAVVKKYDF